MGVWASENWFNVLSAVGIVASLVFTAVSLRSETRIRRIGNLLTLTSNHREIWSQLFDHPSLGRVLSPTADLSKVPMTLNERWYANLVIQHLNSAFEAIKSGLAVKPDGLAKDVGWFLSLPIPQAVWKAIKLLQNEDFAEFVEACISRGGEGFRDKKGAPLH